MKKISILLLLCLIVLNGCKNQAKLDFDLCKAIHKIDYQQVQALLDQGADPNVKDTDGDAILCKAIFRDLSKGKKDRLKIIKLLLKYGADPNSRGECFYKNTTALMFAVTSENSNEMCKLLINKGADVNAQNDVGQTALMRTATGDITLTKLLLQNGADRTLSTKEGMTPFKVACCRNKFEIAKLLFDPIADVNVKTKDAMEFTALMLSALSPSPKIVDMLLKNGADLNIKNKKGKTALDIAIDKNHKEVIDIINKYKKSQQGKL